MVNNSRHLGRIVTKSLTGQPLNWRDNLRLGALLAQIVVTSAIGLIVVCLARPTIGGWALLLGAMVWLVLGAYWCQRG